MATASKATAKKRPASQEGCCESRRRRRPAKPQLKTSPARIAKIIAGLQKAYPGATCALRALESVGAAGRDHPLRAVHGRARQHGHAHALPPLPHPGRDGQSITAGDRRAHPHHRLLPQQGEVDLRRSQGRGRALRRQSAADHGRAAHAPRRRAQDRQRRPGGGLPASPKASSSTPTCCASRAASSSPSTPSRKKSSRIW